VGEERAGILCEVFDGRQLSRGKPNTRIDVSDAPDCPGTGLRGRITDRNSGTAALFETCITAEQARASMWDGAGRPLVTLVFDRVQASARIWIAGVELQDPLAEGDVAGVDEVLSAPELSLAGMIARRLVELGFAPDDLSVALLTAVELLWEDSTSDESDSGDDCFGCCGYGCIGCTGIYTDECRAHDACVRVLGHEHPMCLALLAPAIASYLNCKFSNCEAQGCDCRDM